MNIIENSLINYIDKEEIFTKISIDKLEFFMYSLKYFENILNHEEIEILKKSINRYKENRKNKEVICILFTNKEK